MSARYAIYYSPRPGSPLAAFGENWFTGHGTGRPLIDPALQGQITATARRYAFHATLKAPFRLAEGCETDDLRAFLAAFAKTQNVPAAPPLALRRLHGFLALMFSGEAPEVSVLAQACVETFEPFRAALTAEDLARRQAARLTSRQEANLLRWGYPFVAEDFRFHMTLTSRLSGAELIAAETALGAAVAPLCDAPLSIDALSLFREENPREGFALVERYPLAG